MNEPKVNEIITATCVRGHIMRFCRREQFLCKLRRMAVGEAMLDADVRRYYARFDDGLYYECYGDKVDEGQLIFEFIEEVPCPEDEFDELLGVLEGAEVRADNLDEVLAFRDRLNRYIEHLGGAQQIREPPPVPRT